MGLFDFFKKKKKGEHQADQAREDAKENNPPQQVPQAIEIHAIDNGSHGDHFGGLIGFHTLKSEHGGPFINEHIAQAASKAPTQANTSISIKDLSFKEVAGDTDRLHIRILQSQRDVLSAYPYLKTDYSIPFTTKKIQEWSHVDHIEAEISGGGRETFGFGFFPTDYALNRDQYKTQKNINIKISAIAFVLDTSNLEEQSTQQFSKDFAAYMPSQDILRPTYYDFIGVLLDFEAVRLSNENAGYILKVKLINHEDPDFFSVDLFINKENMRISTLEKGMRVTGALWFQGELA